MNVVLKDRKVQEILGTAGLTPVGGTAEELRSLLAADTTRWSGVIKSADIKMQ
jgi:tripartite-type tricarboxylate transporter receptor subunit TctC